MRNIIDLYDGLRSISRKDIRKIDAYSRNPDGEFPTLNMETLKNEILTKQQKNIILFIHNEIKNHRLSPNEPIDIERFNLCKYLKDNGFDNTK